MVCAIWENHRLHDLACYSPLAPGYKVHEEFVVSGLGPMSDQRVQVPFQILPLGER